MKVLHVVPSFYPAFSYGGPITSLYGLCSALARNGCEVRVLTTDGNGLHAVLEVEKSKPVTLAPGFSVHYCRRIFRHSVSPQMLRLMAPYMRWADVVHLTAVYNFSTFPAMAACRWLGKPLVWSPRGGLQRWQNSCRPGLKSLWEATCRGLAPRGMVLHVTSTEEAAQSLSRFPQCHAVVIPNGVEIPAEIHHADGCGRLRLLFLGRIDPIKGLENLLAACRLLEDKLKRPWSLTIAGSGETHYTAALRQQAEDLGGRVSFVGDTRGQAKADLFANSDIAIFPSHRESFAMVVAEALAHGVPVIASKRTPWSTLADHGCGLWAENDPSSLAAAIVRMSAMPLREMGCRGREWMQTEFSWDRIAREMLEVYGKLLVNSGKSL